MKHHNRAVRSAAEVLDHALEVQSDRLGIKVAVVDPLHTRIGKNVSAPHLTFVETLLSVGTTGHDNQE